MIRSLEVRTNGRGLYEMTGAVASVLPKEADGLVTVFVQHTSASLLIQENADPEVQTDLLAFLNRLVPDADNPAMSYLTHTYEGPDDMPGHIKAALLPTSLQIPFADGRMMLGSWQGIYLVEHRDRPHVRRIVVHCHVD